MSIYYISLMAHFYFCRQALYSWFVYAEFRLKSILLLNLLVFFLFGSYEMACCLILDSYLNDGF